MIVSEVSILLSTFLDEVVLWHNSIPEFPTKILPDLPIGIISNLLFLITLFPYI